LTQLQGVLIRSNHGGAMITQHGALNSEAVSRLSRIFHLVRSTIANSAAIRDRRSQERDSSKCAHTCLRYLTSTDAWQGLSLRIKFILKMRLESSALHVFSSFFSVAHISSRYEPLNARRVRVNTHSGWEFARSLRRGEGSIIPLLPTTNVYQGS
jgi:hypothetical protein